MRCMSRTVDKILLVIWWAMCVPITTCAVNGDKQTNSISYPGSFLFWVFNLEHPWSKKKGGAVVEAEGCRYSKIQSRTPHRWLKSSGVEVMVAEMLKTLVSKLVSSLSPVNHKGLHQGWKQTSVYLHVIHSKGHYTTSLLFSNHN